MEVTINYNGQAVAVEVTLEVYEFLDRADHKTENLFHEQRRHWDGREFDEYIITTEGVGAYGETPEEYLCRMETLHELMAVLDTCTEAQRRRFLLYALDGLSLAEMGHYFRVAADNRDLNYDKFVVKGEVHTMADESYTSHNTERLDVEGTVKKILTTEYVQNALKDIPNV